MKNIDKIFTTNEKGVLEINKPEVRNIKEFKDILVRDKGTHISGDMDGRKKYVAFRELLYVHLYASQTSIYANLPDEARKLKALETVELYDGWKEDSVIKKACLKLIDLENITPLRHGYNNAKKAVYSLGEDIKFFNTQKEKIKKQIIILYDQLDTVEAEEDKQRLEAGVENLSNKLLQLGNKILTLSEKLPNAYDILKDFEKKLLEESEQGTAIYGGGDLGNREA